MAARPEVVAPRRRARGWSVLVVALVTVGALLAPVSLVASFAKSELADTDRFVSTFEPLGTDPAVQTVITDQVAAIISEKIGVPSLASLASPVVRAFVESGSFPAVWRQALRSSHEQFVATMQSDPRAAVAIGSDGSIGVQLGPVIEAVKDALVAQGFTFAASLPAAEGTVTIARSDSLPLLRFVYELSDVVGGWLPFVSLLLIAAGVVLARRRTRALAVSAAALGLLMVLTVAALAAARHVFLASVGPSPLPSDAAGAIWDAATGTMRTVAIAIAVLAFVVALAAAVAVAARRGLSRAR